MELPFDVSDVFLYEENLDAMSIPECESVDGQRTNEGHFCTSECRDMLTNRKSAAPSRKSPI